MANITNRWTEYDAGTLPAGSVVQCDSRADGSYLYWVWTGQHILGPLFRREYSAEVLTEVIAYAAANGPKPPDTYQITCENGTVLTGEVEVR